MDIKVDLSEVASTVSSVTGEIQAAQEEVEMTYSQLINMFEESSGEEADALRRLLECEQQLAASLNGTLAQFAKSVKFAADSMGELDNSIAKSMY